MKRWIESKFMFGEWVDRWWKNWCVRWCDSTQKFWKILGVEICNYPPCQKLECTDNIGYATLSLKTEQSGVISGWMFGNKFGSEILGITGILNNVKYQHDRFVRVQKNCTGIISITGYTFVTVNIVYTQYTHFIHIHNLPLIPNYLTHTPKLIHIIHNYIYTQYTHNIHI